MVYILEVYNFLKQVLFDSLNFFLNISLIYKKIYIL